MISHILGTGTNSIPYEGMQSSVPQSKVPASIASPESEEGRWYHYNEFIWVKADSN